MLFFREGFSENAMPCSELDELTADSNYLHTTEDAQACYDLYDRGIRKTGYYYTTRKAQDLTAKMEGQPFNATGVSEVWGLLGGSNQSALYCDFEALPFKTCWDYHRTGVTTNGWYKAYLGGTTHTIYCDFNEHTSDEADMAKAVITPTQISNCTANDCSRLKLTYRIPEAAIQEVQMRSAKCNQAIEYEGNDATKRVITIGPLICKGACCDTERALDDNCDRFGLCQCKPNFSGSKCESCAIGFFGPKCEHQVRISPGTVYDNQGYVEVLSARGYGRSSRIVWRPCSGYKWNTRIADMVCKTLGFKKGVKGSTAKHCHSHYPYLAPCWNVYMPTYFSCNSSASSLSECTIDYYNANNYGSFANIECKKND